MQNSNEHFNSAVELFEKSFSHAELIKLLEHGNLVEKQYAVLSLDTVNSVEEAHLIVNHLVGVDGKIREAVAFKLVEFTKENPELFFNVENYENFVNGTIDIDGNVCRKVIEASIYMKKDEEFSKFYTKGLLDIIKSSLIEISKFTFRDKKYTINKQTFKIYWCLEALKYFNEFIDDEELYMILSACIKLPEYTIREKCAEIVLKLNDNKKLDEIRNILTQDENYYVRRVFMNN